MRGIKPQDERGRRKLTIRVEELYDQGRSVIEMHDLTHVPKRTLYEWVRAYEEAEKYDDEDRRRFGLLIDSARRRLDDMSYHRMGRELNVSAQEARNYCIGICIPRGERRKKVLDFVNRANGFSSWKKLMEGARSLPTK